MMEWFKNLSAKQREGVPYLALVLAVFAAYANVYGNSFLLDDMVLIVQNEFLRHWDKLPDLLTSLSLAGDGKTGGFYRPLQMLLFFFMYQAFGLSEAAFHGVNVILQAVAACLVYRLGSRLGVRQGAAFAAALLWAVHPVHTESIDCVSGSADPLYTIFCISGILALLPDFSPKKFWLAGLFFILALGSKESAIVFPALAVFTLFLTSKDRLRPATYLGTWPLWLIAAVYLIMGQAIYPHDLAMHDPQDVFYNQNYTHSFINRIFTSLATLPVYLGLLYWPENLHMERSFPIFTTFWSWQVLAGAVMVSMALLQIIWGKARRGLMLSWGLLWFAAAFSPHTGILKPINAQIAEHWMYLPTVGLFLGVAHTLSVWIDSRKSKRLPVIVAVVVALAVLSLGVKTYFQNKVWHDAVSFYENIFKAGENSGRAHNSLSQYYFNVGEYKKSEEHALAAIAHPAPMWVSETSLTHHRLALIYLGARPDKDGIITVDEIARVAPLTPRLSEAAAEFEEVLALNPDDYWAGQFLDVIRDYQRSGK